MARPARIFSPRSGRQIVAWRRKPQVLIESYATERPFRHPLCRRIRGCHFEWASGLLLSTCRCEDVFRQRGESLTRFDQSIPGDRGQEEDGP